MLEQKSHTLKMWVQKPNRWSKGEHGMGKLARATARGGAKTTEWELGVASAKNPKHEGGPNFHPGPRGRIGRDADHNIRT